MVKFNDKSAWAAMHSLTLFCFFMDVALTAFGQNTLIASWPWYKLANTSIIATYIMVIYNNHSNWGITLNSEDFFLMIHATIWVFSPQIIIKLLPFAIYSSLNIAHFLMLDLYPKDQLTIAALPLLNYLEPTLMLATAFLDIILIFVLVIESFIQNSYWGLAFYTYTWALKALSSEHSKNAFIQLIHLHQIRNLKSIKQPPISKDIK